ncbi:ROK family transcriptional regulator [Amycolatopsis tucumanensis]|uniref:ROK family protein n=1 Tax=Amycolatopsis tucumanensis TaxID=401106 RepID=A0ABP7I8Z9_9PSEU|nr:ROK family transcriptional regulator [Amycolatopsis tucumanensis]MCF6425814.1 ROK family transcriptional regulator [Amycolatopsis tucumanensis]
MSNAAAVLGAIRREGPLSRAAIAELTSLSMPTVSRQVTALAEARLVRDAPDLARAGAVGRPRVPVDIDDSVLAACGVHIGVRTTTFGIVDLRGRLVGSEKIPTPRGSAEDGLAFLAAKVRAFLRRWRERRVVGLGLATGGQVDIARGLITHDRLGWHRAPAQAVLARGTGLPVHVDGHVPAMAHAELLFGEGKQYPSLLYFYARQVVGAALVVNGVLHRGPGQAGSVAHLPVGGDVRCACGRTGCLEATVNDQTDRGALAERAATMGRAVAILRDVVNPDQVVLGGQNITDAPEHLATLLHAFAATTALPGTDLVTVTRFGPDVQAVAACTGVLADIFADPTPLMA